MDRSRLGFEVGFWNTAGSTPQGFSLYRAAPVDTAVGAARWLTVSARVAPRQWFVLDAWVSDAVGAGPEGQPPIHSVVNATIQSKFLPTFRSGVFALKLQGTMDSWGTGVIGRTAGGQPVTLRGATFFRAQLQLQIGSFTAYTTGPTSRAAGWPTFPACRFPGTPAPWPANPASPAPE